MARPTDTSPPKERDPLCYALLAALFLIGTLVRVASVDVAVRSPDERIYTAQAHAALVEGVTGTRRVVAAFQKNPQLWLYPPPTRIGYSWLLAAAMTATGAPDETAGSWLSCLASILTLLVTIRLGLRFVGKWATVAGTLFLAVFPPELVIARRCWGDAPVELAAVSMMYLACEIWAGAKRWYPYVLLPVVGSAAVLIKETTVLVYAACLLAALWATFRRTRDLRLAGLLAGAALAGAALASALFAFATGSLSLTVGLILDQARHNSTNAYALEYASGPGYLLLVAFAKLSPLTTALALWGAAVAVVRRDRAVLLAWLTIGNIAIYMLIPHWLNLRYASASFAPLCLLAGAGLVELLMLVKEDKVRWAAVGAATVAMLFAVGDYHRFQAAWGRPEAQDLTVKMVFDVMRQ